MEAKMADEFDNGASGAGGGANATAPIPPYIPFQTFLTFLKQLKTDGLPPQIDKSVLSKFSGGTQGQLKVALKAMGLMDENKPTDQLAALVDAYDTPQFEPLLLDLLHRTYPYVFSLNLMEATPLMFADSFKATGAREDVSRKCRTFFLHAAKRAGVPLGNRLLTGSVPRSNTGAPRKRKAAKPPAGDTGGGTPTPPNPPVMSDKAMEYKLVDLMKEGEIGDDERDAIWTLIKYLTRKAKAAA
jgi:hypothetical protein